MRQWPKHGHKYCQNHGSEAYPSLLLAQEACVKRYPPCGGVYDDDCDGHGRFYLCGQSAYLVQSSANNCVYTVQSSETHECKCENGTPSIGSRCARVLYLLRAVKHSACCSYETYANGSQLEASRPPEPPIACYVAYLWFACSCKQGGVESCVKCNPGFFLYQYSQHEHKCKGHPCANLSRRCVTPRDFTHYIFTHTHTHTRTTVSGGKNGPEQESHVMSISTLYFHKCRCTACINNMYTIINFCHLCSAQMDTVCKKTLYSW